MNLNILTNAQIGLMPLVESFFPDFYLVGGTAIALHLGHRRSIDFDLFSAKDFEVKNIRNRINRIGKIQSTLFSDSGSLTVKIDGIKMTWFYFPFAINLNRFDGLNIKMPDLLTPGAMKAFALGRRAKWKDYVDMYFILEKYSIKDLIERAQEIFKDEFNDKLFRSQLSYFEDVDYTEGIEYLPGFAIKDDDVRKTLEEKCLNI